jgi:hypothetical protein
LNGLKYGLSDSKLVSAIVAGLIAIHVATITGFWFRIIHLPPFDWNRYNGTYLVGAGQGVSDFEVFITGWIFHVFTGLALTLAFVFLIRAKLPAQWFPYTMWGNLLAGTAWGVALALLSMFIIVPYLHVYGANPGFMSLKLHLTDSLGNTRPGWQTPLGILVWHTIFGVQLGSFYNPKSE